MASKGFIYLVCAVAVVLANEKYSDKYDNINLGEIKSNRRLLLSYVNCILEKGKCTPEGKELKDNLQDAIETGCAKCTQKQKEGATDIIEFLIGHELDIWNEVCAKYDPEGKWRKKYEEQAKTKGINIPQ